MKKESSVRLITDEERKAFDKSKANEIRAKAVAAWEMIGDFSEYLSKLGISTIGVTLGIRIGDESEIKILTMLNPRFTDEQHIEIMKYQFSEPETVCRQSHTVEQLYDEKMASGPGACESCPVKEACEALESHQEVSDLVQ